MDPWQICVHYVRTFFLLDALLVTIDFVQMMLVLSGRGLADRGSKFMRLAKLGRILRVRSVL